MATESGSPRTLEELRQEIALSRHRLARDLTGLRHELDFPQKFRQSFRRHSGIWVSAATLLGTLFTIRRPRKINIVALKGDKGGRLVTAEKAKEGIFAAGLAMGGLRFLATLLKPFVVSFVTKRLTNYATKRR